MANWLLQDAKARLSEVVRKASQDGPQHITFHGEPAAVVLSEAAYRRPRKRPRRFIAFVQSCPWKGVELDLTRDRSPPRDITL